MVSAILVVTAPPQKLATTTSVACSVTILEGYIEQVTVTIKVDAAPGQPAPTGGVMLTIGGTYIGTGQLMVNKNVPGEAIAMFFVPYYQHQYLLFCATYLGDATHQGSYGSLYGYI